MFWVVFVSLALLVVVVAWRPHGLGPTLGAAVAVGVAALGGAVGLDDVLRAVEAQWRAYATLASVMAMTSAAERMGLLERLAAIIEPRTRGPVRHAFRVTFALSALVAAVLSNDAAILLMTPTVLVLLRTVYPRRHPKFVVPFAVAVFASAGVAPLVISNPMNLIFADHAGIRFNAYSAMMIPIAIAGWVTAYVALAWMFRSELADPAPALGAWPNAPGPLSGAARIVFATVIAVLCAYPVMSYLDAPLWPSAVVGAVICAAASVVAGRTIRELAGGIAWSIFPFLIGVFVLAIALQRVGVADWLAHLYGAAPCSLATVGVTSAIGSALLNNHPMSVLNAFALEAAQHSSHSHAFAALIGGDLGPRLLPVGSIASLLWYDLLRRHGVVVRVSMFVRVGVALTVPTMAVSLAMLWLLSR
jgi:arsenical pump membrane protein